MKLIVVALLVAGCQHNITTPFPEGLEPLEDNPIPEQTTGPYAEMLTTSSTDSDYVRIYGRGFVQLPPAVVWAATKTPGADVALCSTDQQNITLDDQPQYEFSFVVAYVVNNIVTVQWDDQWRFGTIEGTIDDPMLGMIKHQKIDGSSFITLSEGTIQVTPTADDPNTTELSFIEHLDAVSGGVDDVMKGVQHNYDSIVAVAHGNPVPPCP